MRNPIEDLYMNFCTGMHLAAPKETLEAEMWLQDNLTAEARRCFQIYSLYQADLNARAFHAGFQSGALAIMEVSQDSLHELAIKNYVHSLRARDPADAPTKSK